MCRSKLDIELFLIVEMKCLCRVILKAIIEYLIINPFILAEVIHEIYNMVKSHKLTETA